MSEVITFICWRKFQCIPISHLLQHFMIQLMTYRPRYCGRYFSKSTDDLPFPVVTCLLSSTRCVCIWRITVVHYPVLRYALMEDPVSQFRNSTTTPGNREECDPKYPLAGIRRKPTYKFPATRLLKVGVFWPAFFRACGHSSCGVPNIA